MTIWIALGVAALVLLLAIATFNKLVRLRQQARAAWAQIDVQLKRRYELIPNLVETVKGYMAHERATLEAVTAARDRAQAAGDDVAMRGMTDGLLGGAIGRLMARAEAYPELKASDNMLALQEELASTENRIAFARQHYNDCTMELNTAVGSFPDLLLAGPLGFKAQSMFEADEASRVPVAVKL